MKLFDAHNHLQDERFGEDKSSLIEECSRSQIAAMVVNGSCEDDWKEVRSLARNNPKIIPAFGYHPWYVHQASPQWRSHLTQLLDLPGASVGEIGLDRWKPGLDFELQRRFFIAQLEIAQERNLAVSIHCLKAWGPLLEILQKTPLPARGFLIHSYSGPVEMINALVTLGAYFSCAGNYLAPDKSHKFEVFSHVPLERLLAETDAPDQLLPSELDQFQLVDTKTGNRINHPANLKQVYQALAKQRYLPPEEFSVQLEDNFIRLFGQR